MVMGAALFFDLGKSRKWWGEAGYNHWIWGESARQYREPYFGFGRRY